MKKTERQYLEEVVILLGGRSFVANHFGVSGECVSNWLTRGIPAERVAELSKLTKGKIKCHQLKPGCFPKPI